MTSISLFWLFLTRSHFHIPMNILIPFNDLFLCFHAILTSPFLVIYVNATVYWKFEPIGFYSFPFPLIWLVYTAAVICSVMSLTFPSYDFRRLLPSVKFMITLPLHVPMSLFWLHHRYSIFLFIWSAWNLFLLGEVGRWWGYRFTFWLVWCTF